MASPRLLVAIDIDGTLLRTDGAIAPEDRDAIASARAAGAIVTLATGRLTTSALPVARELGMTHPMVCADGAVIFSLEAQEPIKLVTLGREPLASLFPCLRRHGLAPFVFTHGAIRGTAEDLARFSWLDGWTPHIVARAELDAEVAAHAAEDVVTAIGIGSETMARAAEAALLASGAGGDLAVFPIGSTGEWVLRLTPSGCSKATGLAVLAERFGLDRHAVAVIGDWYNDIPMFEWAGHSFAMGHAPPDVARTARHQLTATSATGGGVAEALTHLAVDGGGGKGG